MWGSLQQYMSRIARQNRVLFFAPGRNPEQSQLREMYRNSRYFVSPRAHAVNDNLVIIPTPTSLPYARERLPEATAEGAAPLIARLNTAILTRHIRWAMKTFRVNEPILWLYEPRHYALAGRFH